MKASVIFAIAIALPTAAAAADMAMPMANATQSDDVKWGPAPPMLPPGAQLAVMTGSPMAPGFVSIRAKLPAGYTIAPHTHPTDEHVTVISGTFQVGMGSTFKPDSMLALATGGFVTAPAGHAHFARAQGPTIVQVHAIGPFALTYVNPSDLPVAARR